jgi:hypothetical protein
MATQSPYLAQTLKDKGYIGVTGSTPYRQPTSQETATLQDIYQDTSVTTVPKTVATGVLFTTHRSIPTISGGMVE